MIIRDHAIALRIHPYGNTSRVIVWLTRHHGKVVTLAKGSQRPKSSFLGQIDLFYTCEILFYSTETRQVHILKECAPLELRLPLREDWRACAMASYAAGLIDRLTPTGPLPPQIYEILAENLEKIEKKSPGPAFLPKFELKLLQELGFSPKWDICSKCRVPLPQSGAPARLRINEGALLCANCANSDGFLVGADTLRAIHDMTSEIEKKSLPEGVFREIRAIMGGLLEYHAEIHEKSREIAFQILQNPQKPAFQAVR